MRFQPYAGASVALAASVVLRALHERPNFYSVCVYLAQSNACIMILTNLVLLVLGCFLLGLQKLLYGPLRPIEIEQLYEKAWFAVTETCLAMTVFRTKVGAFFIVMFVSLLVGKVWGWIGEGRVEILEQQPPQNPRLFHARLSSSLALSFLFDAYFLNYAITTVAQQREPDMMVMFAFEFAVLTVTSLSTCARYALSLRETAVIHKQTTQRLAERRQQRLRERKAAADQAQENGEDPPEFPPVEEEIDEFDIDVPGWEEKGRWAFYLDLATDFFKLILYLTFFCVLCIIHGIPIHIIRDVALTVRSFYNRVTDFIKYRHATRDMNQRYPDATADEIAREDTCIICREPMRAWHPPDAVQGEGPAPMEERLRPKKLPCGHILHFSCLRSWLERQQKCPTCRQDVVVSPSSSAAQEQPRDGQPRPAQNQNGAPRGGENRGNDRQPQNRIRFLNLGPIRVGFGAGNDPQALRDQLAQQRAQRQQRPQQNTGEDTAHRSGASAVPGRPEQVSSEIASQLQRVERQLMQQAETFQLQQEQLRLLRGMQREVARLSARQQAVQRGEPDLAATLQPRLGGIQGYGAAAGQQPMGSGHADLPSGLVVPEGWTVTPLTQIAPPGGPPMVPHANGQFPMPPTVPLPVPPPMPAQSAANGAPTPPPAVPQNGDAGSHLPINGGGAAAAHGNGNVPLTASRDSLPASTATSASESQAQAPQPPAEPAPLPNWGARPSSLQPSGSKTSERTDGGSADASGMAPDGPSDSDKGKAKAATVEEATEDDAS